MAGGRDDDMNEESTNTVRDWEYVEKIFWHTGTWVCVDSPSMFIFLLPCV